MIAREELKAQALSGSPKALVECLNLLKKDVAENPGQHSSIFAEFIAWGLFPALFDIDKAPPETEVDCAIWCQRLRLLPVRLAAQIILAEPAGTDEQFHAAIWSGVLRWIMFLSRLDDGVCQSLDPSVFQLVGAIARDLTDFLARKPQLQICHDDTEATHKLLSSLVRLGFFCPTQMFSTSVYAILEGHYSFHRQPLPLELAAQIARVFVIDVSWIVENGKGFEGRFLDRFLLLRLLIAEDQTLARQLSEKRCGHWLVACLRSPMAVQLRIQLQAYASRVDHVLYCLHKLIKWVGIPAASEILSSGFLDVTSSPDFRLLVQWDQSNGERDIDHGEIGLQQHMHQIIQGMQELLVWQSFIRAIRRPIAAFQRSETYRDHFSSPRMRAFLEIASMRQRTRKDYIRRCGNPVCDDDGRGQLRYVCSQCKYIRYCSRDCQRVDWRAGGHRTGCAPVPVGSTLVDHHDTMFLCYEVVLPFLQKNAAGLQENVSHSYDIVLSFLDGGHGFVMYYDRANAIQIDSSAGQSQITVKAVNRDGDGEVYNSVSMLSLTADGELVWDAAGRSRHVLVT